MVFWLVPIYVALYFIIPISEARIQVCLNNLMFRNFGKNQFSDVLVKVGDFAVFCYRRGLFIDFAYINNRVCLTMPGAWTPHRTSSLALMLSLHSFIHSFIHLTPVRKIYRKLQLFFLINTDLKYWIFFIFRNIQFLYYCPQKFWNGVYHCILFVDKE